MKYAFLILIFLYIVYRHTFWSGIKVIFSKKEKKDGQIVNNENLLKIIKEKADVKNIVGIKILNNPTFTGLMVGIPGKPVMAISKEAYETFSKDQMEWLLLHESGHYVLHHGIKQLIYQFVFIIAGISILNFISSFDIIISMILGILFSILVIQIAKMNEYEANHFAIKRMDNPQGMIDGAHYLIKKYYIAKDYDNFLKKKYRKYFQVWENEMHLKQIEDAQKEITFRNT